jgi:hypothetical protein
VQCSATVIQQQVAETFLAAVAVPAAAAVLL